jgi:MoaA/NifB/PqqE/SkfB family radical SAM enzyme
MMAPMLLPRRLGLGVWRGVAAACSPARPLLVQLVVTRRCNLSCGYCEEYDHRSGPVPAAHLARRVDRAAELGALVLTFTGGEPLLHPDLPRLVARASGHGMVCTVVSNGSMLTPTWIERLNEAGLNLLQVSIDNLEPDDRSRKSWSALRAKLPWLRERARFPVNVNAVLGACPPDVLRQLARDVRDAGFYMTFGLMHDEAGQVVPALVGNGFSRMFGGLQRSARKTLFHRSGEGWEQRLLDEGRAPWKCRAGGRYLYVDEDGLVSYCSARRGEPGVPLLEYDAARVAREFKTRKTCETGCAIGCARRASALDRWRR